MPNGNQTLPVREEIARRAYELYEARGEQNGSDVDDWLTAEREVQEQLPRSSGWPIAEGKVQFPKLLSEDSSTNSSPENHGSLQTASAVPGFKRRLTLARMCKRSLLLLIVSSLSGHQFLQGPGQADYQKRISTLRDPVCLRAR